MTHHFIKTKWLYAALVVLLGNMWLYHTSAGQRIIPHDDAVGVVLGSLIDLALIVPLLVTLHVKKKSFKLFALLVISGLVLARFVIPAQLLAPFRGITTAALVAEGVLILIELSIITYALYYAPAIYRKLKERVVPLPFALIEATNTYMKENVLLHALQQEVLIVYYAVFGWRKQAPSGYTLYKQSMYVPVMIMILHAVVLEAVAFHWLLHDWMPIVAYMLLALHIYSVIFVLADMQAMRLNPTVYRNNTWYVSFGLLKRTELHRDNMKAIHGNMTVEKSDIVYFQAPTFGEEAPHFIVELHEPQPVQFMMGMKKTVRYIGIQADDASLQEAMQQTIQRGNTECQKN
ncbi:MAG: hypothetical protein UHX00_07515 [Caryophanon sp.]|nr:hypothetical protein [Caryophanon sp.]